MAYQAMLAKGIAHLQGRDDHEDAKEILAYIENNQGNQAACIGQLGMYHEACCLLTWFQDHNKAEFVHHANLAATLKAMQLQKRSVIDNDHYINSSYLHLYPLLSNNIELIAWSMQNVHSMYGKTRGILDRNNVNKFEYHSFNTILALRGEWPLLAKRCQYILANPTTVKRLVRYQVDHEFYLALAQGDITAMQNCLKAITSKRIRSKEFGFGLTENLISTYAVIFAKIAWLHGFEVKVESPLVPDEWLPMTPLANYRSPYGFLNEFDIFTPYGGSFAKWSPLRNKADYRDITLDSDPYDNQ